MSPINYVHIPWDCSLPLQNLDFEAYTDKASAQSGDRLPGHLVEEAKAKLETNKSANKTTAAVEFEIVPLRRMSESTPGVYAYYRRIFDEHSRSAKRPNIRATCLLMACGQYSKRFYGDVFIGRYGKKSEKIENLDIIVDEIYFGCITPDLRKSILKQLVGLDAAHIEITRPQWIVDASKESYLDSIQISALAKAFQGDNTRFEGDESSVKDDDDRDEINHDSALDSDDESSTESESENQLRNTTLCLYCRAPCEFLCDGCHGAYFCKKPRMCGQHGWSHSCLCKTWQIYVKRRDRLSEFPFPWSQKLMEREYQVSDLPYRTYLSNDLRVLGKSNGSWWDTEIDGWAAGLSGSAQRVDASIRRSYADGFVLNVDLIPPARHVTDKDCVAAGIRRDAHGLPIVEGWDDYYSIRSIPLQSPVALLCTFPLTLYYIIQKYGEVPITVAKMLNRKLRIHVVGVEKEMNFLDLFKELAYILPLGLKVELTFIVRPDMVPPKCRQVESQSRGYDMKIDLAENLTLMVKSGTYGDELDPLFGDVGSGAPDMIVGLNAGLFAYKSWSSVVCFCNENPNIVAVFTDYNEHSGMNCASLGGGKARDSLIMNPFRQPLAMPVYCMNLPQFSNGFLYVFNEQELDF